MCVQKVIQDLNPEIIPINNPVGESACNSQVENAVRRIHEKMKTFRHQFEQCIGQSIPDQPAIMAWMAKWAVELISKYPPGEDGKIPDERTRQERCQVLFAQFGESAMCLPMKTATPSKGIPTRRPSACLGVIERTEDMIIDWHQCWGGEVPNCESDGQWRAMEQRFYLADERFALGICAGQTRHAHIC